jgi:hypothetical protein
MLRSFLVQQAKKDKQLGTKLTRNRIYDGTWADSHSAWRYLCSRESRA